MLGDDLQELDIQDGGDHRQGFVDIGSEQQEVRRARIEVMSGGRPQLVSATAPAPPSPFPPHRRL